MILASLFFAAYSLICERQPPRLQMHLHIHNCFFSISSSLSSSTIAFSSKIFSKEFDLQNTTEENLSIKAEAFLALYLTAYQEFASYLWFLNIFGYHSLGALNSSLIHKAKSIHLFPLGSKRRKFFFLV